MNERREWFVIWALVAVMALIVLGIIISGSVTCTA